ncbi:hypothetical protein CONPUDRAFT_68730 [Coniophora puteana RWD-64-598 SS2]|uniref:Transmembrane protein n=1 Tax=Coniophora puteana (strain RWD-64-598) TaxID=741705 RepID=A0A5M3N494_CONPW|nr:uncharacterized protein CONPUDRAFT_68730 [Coniophora puteana RWD-64-598 SS2]EIW86128.1 hypothetical protein CONPUDRAFT_68730 [Coniophora puteana RWD-64-598 SS2]
MVEESILQIAPPSVNPTALVVNTAAWLAMLMGDGLLLWRFKVVWGNSLYFPYVAVPAVALYISNVVIGVFTAIIFNVTNRNVWTGQANEDRVFMAYWMVTLSLNIYITTLIAGRLWAYRRRFHTHLGSVHPKHCTSIGGMLVESCSALIVFTTLLAITYLTNSPAQYMMCVVLVQVQIIAPLMVMIRISRGIAWDADVTTASMVENAIDRALESLKVESGGFGSAARLSA